MQSILLFFNKVSLRSYKLLFLLVICSLNISIDSIAQCQNGNLESNNFSNWNLSSGPRGNPYVVLNNQVTGYNSAVHNISTVGFDPNVGGSLLNMVGEGLYSLQIGGITSQNQKSSRASYTFTVTAANADFGFKYALVLQDGNHIANENPFFTWSIVRGNNPNILSGPNLITSNQVVAKNNNPFFKTGQNGTIYRNWSAVCYDLTEFIGQQVTISFLVADCVYEQGHYGYAYIDGLCTPNNPTSSFNLKSKFCINDSIVMDGSASTEEDNYYVSVQEVDQWWSILGAEYGKWFPAQQAGLLDLKALLNSLGTEFKCNKYYKVKLAVSNNCDPWVESSKLIKILCPPIIDLPDITLCCNNDGQTVTLGPIGSTSIGTNFSWNIQNGNSSYFEPLPSSNSNSAVINVSENTTIQYSMSSLFATGIYPTPNFKRCTASEILNIKIIDDFTVSIVPTADGCCKTKLKVNIQFADGCNKWEDYSPEQQNMFLNNMNILWSNGDTGAEIVATGPSSVYNVTVSLPGCFSHTASYNYTQSLAYHPNSVYSVQLQASNALEIGDPTGGGKLLVIASTYDNIGLLWPPLGTYQGIYKADSIQMKIWNRWGEEIRTIKWKDCGALKQGDVFWDGKDVNGNYVQDGVYIWRLYIRTCTDGSFRPVCEDTGFLNLQPDECVKRCWGHIPGAPWWRWGYYCCATNNPGDCAYKVTVLK